ncbi:NUDIX hydrolase [Cyanobacterium stanieri LEGE 03274]|uniref:NUDIX hydrolase n=1 Tax=Cyanobacterium stanieri LEGE 03274 TaxID=1828756 RepID=A0ABR9V2Y1_9CHRO|nr:NUDIX hydrolase [Cyanobacterium stanieri]MBE9221179.1 NUDIX hydrolase [Cyanobacterium stanieri LEGE 03274]
MVLDVDTVVYKNPAPTVDIIIEMVDRRAIAPSSAPEFKGKSLAPIVLIERKFEPLGWAIPGGFVDYGESVEQAAMREALEEVSLRVDLLEQFYVYSDPRRDSRKHTISIVFIAHAKGEPKADDDALNLGIFPLWDIPKNLCFDHDRILADYVHYKLTGDQPMLQINN